MSRIVLEGRGFENNGVLSNSEDSICPYRPRNVILEHVDYLEALFIVCQTTVQFPMYIQPSPVGMGYSCGPTRVFRFRIKTLRSLTTFIYEIFSGVFWAFSAGGQAFFVTFLRGTVARVRRKDRQETRTAQHRKMNHQEGSGGGGPVSVRSLIRQVSY